MKMDFKKITIADKSDIESAYRRAGIIDCDMAFANLICWEKSNPAQICRIGGFIVIRIRLDEDLGDLYSLPLGDGDYRSIMPMLEADAASLGEPLRLIIPSESRIEEMRRIYPDFGFFYRRGHSDYIYSREELATLHGKKLQPKRNHVNKFKALYDFTYSGLSADDRQECLDLLHRWREQRLAEADVPSSFIAELDDEQASIQMAFDNYDALGLVGGILRVDGKVVAFTYGSAVSEDTVCVHIEKGDESYDGVFAAINQQFAEHLPENFKYVNRENDLALQGLRRAKESYHPVRLLNKYIGVKLTPTMQEIRKLWLECFEHDTPLDAEEFLLTRFDEGRIVAHSEDGRLAAMLHIVPFGASGYIYAVSTAPAYRHRGIASALIREAFARCKSMGLSEAILIPDNELAASWYEEMGFKGHYPVIFNTIDEFDFFAICDDYQYGKCDGTPDLAMVYPLTPDAPVRNDGETIYLSDLD